MNQQKRNQNKIKAIRQKIDLVDKKLLKILQKRFIYAARLAHLKEADSIADPAREQILKGKWLKLSEKLNLNQNFTLKILDTILTESKNIQKKLK